jgi:protein-tyrosine-phosphatase
MAGTPGRGVDAGGDPVVDPTQNVLDLVEAAIRRQDDLRVAEARHVREVVSLQATIAEIREGYSREIRESEAARLDAIRAVDVGAVNRAAEVAATQAQTLAAQVATSAETLRTQVAAAASAATIALAAALEPVQKDIADLRRAQYEAQGQKTQVVETREVRGEGRQGDSLRLQFLAVVIAALLLYLALRK